MDQLGPRIGREMRTVSAMIALYCSEQHKSHGALCAECDQINNYAMERLRRCPFQESKTTCAQCQVHYYQIVMRERIRAVMRYAGPRMLYRHPVLAVQHLLDGRRKVAVRPAKARSSPINEALK
jgi:hypothetical protein